LIPVDKSLASPANNGMLPPGDEDDLRRREPVE
jgi:hypothetical protein